MTEVPVTADAASVQLVDELFYAFLRHSQHSGGDVVIFDIAFYLVVRQDLDTAKHRADELGILFKYRGQTESELFKIQMRRDRPSKVSGADQDHIMDFAYS